VDNPLRRPAVGEAGREALDQPDRPVGRPEQQPARVRGDLAAIEIRYHRTAIDAAKAGGAHDPRAAQLARPRAPRGAVRPIVVDAPVAGDLAVDRAPVAAEPLGDLVDAHTHLNQAAQAASLLGGFADLLRAREGPPWDLRWWTWLRKPCRSMKASFALERLGGVGPDGGASVRPVQQPGGVGDHHPAR